MTINRKNRRMSYEAMEKRELFTADLGMDTALAETVETESYDGGEWFVADSFSFGVEREMKESGEKGGTEDINIGLGELQECSTSESTDLVDVDSGGEESGGKDAYFVKVDSETTTQTDAASTDEAIQSWSTSGDADDRPTEE